MTAFTKIQAELKNVTAKFQEYQKETKFEQQKLSTTLQDIHHNQEIRKKKRSSIPRLKALLKRQTKYVKHQIEQIYDCYNKLNKQEQTIGQHRRRHLEPEAKTDQNHNQITTQLKDINTKVNTVTTKTGLLEQCFDQIT